MKRLLCVLLCLAVMLTLLAGCDGRLNLFTKSGDEDPTGESGDKNPTEGSGDHGSQIPILSQEEKQRQTLYDYLKNELLPKAGLANLGPFAWRHEDRSGGVQSNVGAWADAGCYGIISAVARDFDLDGQQDLVVFTLGADSRKNTWKPIYGDRNDLDAFVVSMDLYTLEDGKVLFSDSYPCLIQLDAYSWGFLRIRMEQLEDGIYLDAFSDAQDFTTYGSSPRTIFHVADGKFVFDYIGGIGYGQGSLAENPNRLMNTTNIDPTDYTFGHGLVTPDKVDPAAPAENRYVYSMTIGVDEKWDGDMTYTGVDFTGLRTILEKGVDAFPHEPLPQGGKIPEDPALPATRPMAEALAQRLFQQAGCSFIDVSDRVSSDSVTYFYETEINTTFTIRFAKDGYRLMGFGVATNAYPVPQEWFDLKDAALQSGEYSLSADAIAPFLGKRISYNDHMGGTQIPGATVTIQQITDTYFSIEFD